MAIKISFTEVRVNAYGRRTYTACACVTHVTGLYMLIYMVSVDDSIK